MHSSYKLLVVSVISIFTLFVVSAEAQTVYFYNGAFQLSGNGRVYNGTTTTFSYTVCALTAYQGQGFSHITFEIPLCTPALSVVSCSPGNCTIGPDPTTGIDGIKWDDTLTVGQCRNYSFSLQGNVPSGNITVAIKAGNCNQTNSCDTEVICGPGCGQSPTPTRTATKTPTASRTPCVSATPTRSKTPTSSRTPCRTSTKTPTPTKTPTGVPSSTPTNTPLPRLSCDAGGPYAEIPCGQGVATLQLDGTRVNGGDTDGLVYIWGSDCPNHTFDNVSAISPRMTFTSTAQDKTPIYCQVSLIISDVETGVRHSSSCFGLVSVGECKTDCLGQVGGTAQFDNCGVCNGDGTSCLNCEDTNVAATLVKLDSNAGTQRALIESAVKLLLKTASTDKATKAYAASTLKEAEALYLQSWGFIWSIPQVLTSCPAAFCAEISHSGFIEGYNANSESLNGILREAVRRLRKFGGKTKSVTRLLNRGRKLNEENFALSASLPPATSSCVGK